MKKNFLFILFIGFMLSSMGMAQSIAGWDFSTMSGGNGNFGPSPLTATTADANLTVGGLTRGSGFGTLTSTGAALAWGSNNFTTNGTMAGEITANKFFYFTITANSGYKVSLSGIAAYNIRRSSSGPNAGQWQYQIGSGTFQNIGSAITWGSVTSSTGNPQSAIDLSGISDLQNVAYGTTITVRLVNYGATSATGTCYLKDLGNTTTNDFIVNGTVESTSSLTAPILTAAGSATVDADVAITFADDANWRAAVTAVKINGSALTATTDYTLTASALTLKPSGLNSLLTASGSKTVTVEATGYPSTSVTQPIGAGAPTTAYSTISISPALALGTTSTVTLTAKDQYNNAVSGYYFSEKATVSNTDATTAESYTLNGSAVTSSQGTVQSIGSVTNASGAATFTIAIPWTVDGNDGLSTQFYLSNGSTTIGPAFSFYAPLVSITGTINTFGNIVTGASSTAQSYTVAGINLTDNLIVTPPASYEISTSNSPFTAQSTITLVPSSGTVSTTTIYVRFSPSEASGTIAGTITNASTGAATQSVSVSGVALSAEPTAQTTISFSNIASTSLDINLTLPGSGSGSNRIVVMKSGSPVSFTPTDGNAVSGVSSVFTLATDQGSGNRVVYDGTGSGYSTVSVTGLSSVTTYYFQVFEYNAGTGNSQNYLTSVSSTASQTTDVASNGTYTWNGAVSTDFTTASNWTPARSAPATTDVLRFNSGSTYTITAVPTQTIGRLVLANSTTVTLQAGATGTVLTIAGNEGTDLDVPAGSALNISGTNTLKLYLGTGTVGIIGGTITYTGAAHKLDAYDAAVVNSAGIIFQSGASFTQGSGVTGNVFTNGGTASAIIFSSGANFNQLDGSNPFGLGQPSSKVVFQAGSNFIVRAAGIIPAFSGRTYANLEYNVASAAANTSGGFAVSIDNLTITAGTLNFNVTGTPGHSIKGNISVASGATLNFAPTAAAAIQFSGNIFIASGATLSFAPTVGGTFTFSGTSAQTITNAGTFNTASLQTFVINNASGVSLGSDLTLNGTLTLTNGLLTTGSYALHFGTSVSDPTETSASRIVGNAIMDSRAVGTGTLSFLGAALTGATDMGNVTVARVTGTHLTGASHQSINVYWDITGSGTAPFADRSLALSWLSDYDNGKIFSATNYGKMYLTTDAGTSWQTVGSASDMSGTASHATPVTATASFARFTVSDAAAPLISEGPTTVSVTLLPEGYASNYATNAALATDTIIIHLASVVSPFTDVEAHSAFINPSTLTASAPFTTLTNGNYYIYVTHHNTVETWSKSAQSVTAGTPVTYNFTDAKTKAYGDNLVLKSGKYCIYTGDVDSSKYIDNNDLLLIDNDAFRFANGNLITDLDGSRFVDNNDLLICDNNAFNFIGALTPKNTNPVPVISSLNPASITEGSSAFILTVNGSGFVASSIIQWNGTNLATTYVSATQLQAIISATSIVSAGTANVTVYTGTPGGGTSSAQTFTISAQSSPAPVLSSVSPGSITAGASDFTLTATGSNFVASSVIQWNGSSLTTIYVSPTQLQATIPAASVVGAGTASVTVYTAAPGGGTSSAVTFTINAAPNPAPVLSSVSPTSVTAGASAFTLTATGSSFIASSVIQWNGSSLTTTYVSATQLQATISATSVASAGTASITVYTPTPGGGTSSAVTFTINAASNPNPALSSIDPTSIASGSSDFTLTATGTGFISSSVIKWNGTSLTTSYVSATQLQATVPASNVASASTASVTVYTPAPGGGTSSAQSFSVFTASSNVNLTMGNPSGAVNDVNYPSNFLIERPQYCLSYSRDRGIPNWVSWQLNTAWATGPGVRKDNFTADPLVPSAWYSVGGNAYSGSGFSRGHMCPSADRIITQSDNDTVFYMTNMIPQNQTNNGGVWEEFETYCRTLAKAGNVLYIISGGYGDGGVPLNSTTPVYTLQGGKIAVPAKTWKVVMVLPDGTNDVSRVTTSTRCIAVIMNNDNGPFNSWGTYRVSVDYIESLTGYDFFSNVSPSIQAVIEAVVDNQ